MTTSDPFAARYDAEALAAQQQQLLEELAQGILREDTLYLFAVEGNFLQAVEPVKDSGAWCGRIETEGGSWYVIAPGMAGTALDESCTPYGPEYPLRIADYTDGLWNRGVLDSPPLPAQSWRAPVTFAPVGRSTRSCRWMTVTLAG